MISDIPQCVTNVLNKLRLKFYNITLAGFKIIRKDYLLSLENRSQNIFATKTWVNPYHCN